MLGIETLFFVCPSKLGEFIKIEIKQSVKLNRSFPEILFILLPFSLITGPFLSGLSSIVIAFYGILYLIYDKNPQII